ncbi:MULTISPECIES: YdbL family protein [Alkalimonas]|uniref:YdbL family protein n=1 Tax=Alkalimonas mucilaginosa TaxID=3057676 RepID=A0ABU7JJI3_9GAMM|nr:YdbL family protein [Alkalimonas sp. MEB004]MEE2025596.1 YdbL family protein [Alkalimonas sp. MEB004]
MKATTTFRTLLATLLLVCALPVMAMNLQQAMNALGPAKEQGLIGEQINGYLGLVQDNAQSRQIVELINDARRAEYSRIARDNNIAVADVEARAGQRAIERTPTGQFVKLDGQWVRKR